MSQLAQDSFEAFKPFINVFDCGISVGYGPFHLIAKEDWRLTHNDKSGSLAKLPFQNKFPCYKRDETDS